MIGPNPCLGEQAFRSTEFLRYINRDFVPTEFLSVASGTKIGPVKLEFSGGFVVVLFITLELHCQAEDSVYRLLT